MCSIKNKLSRDDKEKIFGVTEVSEVNIKDLEFRYEMAGNKSCVRQQVYRDKNGNYYLAVWGKKGAMVCLSLENLYYPDGRALLIPVRLEALSIWLTGKLCGKDIADHKRACEEFQYPEYTDPQAVLAYQRGEICEYLYETDGDLYILYSTEYDYPYPGFSNSYLFCGKYKRCPEDGFDGPCIYYVTPETARRWAEARGMGETICKAVFGHRA